MCGLTGGEIRVQALSARALSVALCEPFVIASGRIDATRAVEVRATVAWRGAIASGLGEAACLPPVTREDQPDVLREVDRAAGELIGRRIEAREDELRGAIEDVLPSSPVTRAGVETALLDALARLAGVPLHAMLGSGLDGAVPGELETDVTIPIGEPEAMAALARSWLSRGFRTLKVKVGKDLSQDVHALEVLAAAAPEARWRVDANAGYSARQAIALARVARRLGLRVECWEQPCAADDLDGMAEVAAAVEAPVIADESVRTIADFDALVERRYAAGVNLKLAKLGGVLVSCAIGRTARAKGLLRMVGGMVETRLGMTAAAHVACALGGVEFVDLDTAWLLADDPYEGGYVARGAWYALPPEAGLGVRPRSARDSDWR